MKKKISTKDLKKIEKQINEDPKELGSYLAFSSENRSKIATTKLKNGRTVQIQTIVTSDVDNFI